jgi:molecular chaperone DnaK (HSP70)
MVLGEMKETAKAYLGKKVTHTIVMVPACMFLLQVVLLNLSDHMQLKAHVQY